MHQNESLSIQVGHENVDHSVEKSIGHSKGVLDQENPWTRNGGLGIAVLAKYLDSDVPSSPSNCRV